VRAGAAWELGVDGVRRRERNLSQRALTSSSPRGVLTLVSRRKPKPHHGGNHCRDDRNRGQWLSPGAREAKVIWKIDIARWKGLLMKRLAGTG